MKIIAYKVISKIKFNKSLIDFKKLSSADYESLRITMNSLEEGAIFRSLGIGNLLEGDFFSWYSTDKQWNKNIGKLIQKIFIILTDYEDKAIFESGESANDFFKDLFMEIIPDKVRHSLGEYYTPPWLADNLIEEAIKQSNKTNWKALDPCAGSGTFLTVLIRRILEETKNLPNEKRLKIILNRVKGIDLNPLAVLTARINYFINISPLISSKDIFEIPVYLGDSSYVPSLSKIGRVKCLSYRIKTIKGYLDIDIPLSTVSNPDTFSKTMTSIEEDIHNLDISSIYRKLINITSPNDHTDEIKSRIKNLAQQLVKFEEHEWNGIWARIITNFLTTANLGKFDVIVGNPPWIDWKNLPAGYRDRIKSICVDRHLFSGDSVTGGINLNICALISNVSAQNWLNHGGVLSFLMPQCLIFQQTYEGFREFWLDNGKRLYLQMIFDWTKSGHPFSPVQHKFLTFFFSEKKIDYSNGIPVTHFIKQKRLKINAYQNTNSFSMLGDVFAQEHSLIGQANKLNTIFSYANDINELSMFKKISGESYYKGREGIEFYPQELFLLEADKGLKGDSDKIFVKNYQNKKSKYKIPQETFYLEKKYLHPLIKGVDIKRFHLTSSEFMVPFPYEKSNTRSPIDIKTLTKKSKLLAQYFNKFKNVIEAQTNYNNKIIGKKHNNEFYALARVGEYSFADHYVAFRDNTKWQAVVVNKAITPWNELKRPQFQNHAVTISQNENGKFISLDEAHFICAILNTPIISKFVSNSSDLRTFKIRPQVYIPKFDDNNDVHLRMAALSKEAHEYHDDMSKMKAIDLELDTLVIRLKESETPRDKINSGDTILNSPSF